MSERHIHIFCGTGTGKTAAAVGNGIRKASSGSNVFLIQYLKGEQSEAEKEYFQRMEPEIKFFRFEKYSGKYESLSDTEREEEVSNLRNGLHFAKKVLLTEECDVLILDEILGLPERGIITMDELRELIHSCQGNTELYLTGMARCEELWPDVDEVTEISTLYRRSREE